MWGLRHAKRKDLAPKPSLRSWLRCLKAKTAAKTAFRPAPKSRTAHVHHPLPSCKVNGHGRHALVQLACGNSFKSGRDSSVCIDMFASMYVCIHACMPGCLSVCLYTCTFVCMYVGVHVCFYVCTYFCMYVGVHVCLSVCLSVCMFVFKLCMYACVYVCMYVCMLVCICSCMYMLFVCMYVCTYVHMYVCTYASMYVCMYACMHECMYACLHVKISRPHFFPTLPHPWLKTLCPASEKGACRTSGQLWCSSEVSFSTDQL